MRLLVPLALFLLSWSVVIGIAYGAVEIVRRISG
jgi:hypothetical protein